MTMFIQVIDVFIPYDMKLIVDSFLDHFVSFLHVEAEKDPMEGTFGSPVDGIGNILWNILLFECSHNLILSIITLSFM